MTAPHPQPAKRTTSTVTFGELFRAATAPRPVRTATIGQ